MLPKAGKNLHRGEPGLAFADLMAQALTDELGTTHQAVKTVMRWTGASERSAKHWLAGTHAPHGAHLVALMRHSDKVTQQLLAAAGRYEMVAAVGISRIRSQLHEALAILEKSD
jgi:hypothetical protein